MSPATAVSVYVGQPVPVYVSATTPMSLSGLHRTLVYRQVDWAVSADAFQHRIHGWLPAGQMFWQSFALSEWQHIHSFASVFRESHPTDFFELAFDIPSFDAPRVNSGILFDLLALSPHTGMTNRCFSHSANAAASLRFC